MENFLNNLSSSKTETTRLKEVIEKEYARCKTISNVQMCKVFSSKIYQILKENGFDAYLCDSLDYGEGKVQEDEYAHTFVIAVCKEERNEKLFLIDFTFSQFEEKENSILNPKMLVFPATILRKEEEMLEVVQNLEDVGFSEITVEGIQKYLGSLNQLKSYAHLNTIEDILYPNRKRNKETPHK